MYLKEEYVKRMDRISMKYGKHGVKEEDSGSIHSVLSRKWRKTESEGETLNVEKNQNGSFISLLYSRDFFLIRFYHDLSEIFLWFMWFLCLPK